MTAEQHEAVPRESRPYSVGGRRSLAREAVFGYDELLYEANASASPDSSSKKASISASGLDLPRTRNCRDRMQSAGFPCHGGDRRFWTPDKWDRLVAFPSAPKCLVEGHQLDASYALGNDVLGPHRRCHGPHVRDSFPRSRRDRRFIYVRLNPIQHWQPRLQVAGGRSRYYHHNGLHSGTLRLPQ